MRIISGELRNRQLARERAHSSSSPSSNKRSLQLMMRGR
jgi:hypothetical protein